ncbi:hypothetical protein ACIP98_17255 [Streptomyces sp. NPDC088354]|uniref:hypothetical protein n=1 Tax=unclassified Streptomyces TaxID=2593676 RepID=UPI0029A8F2A6|nr:hypothetical protein [Streptomyces sp. MI02-7b]MDX3078492.1 hypothetical protein [Streptomyces sp. MI02-7b]
MAPPTATDVALSAPAGELIAVVGPPGPQRSALQHALNDAPWHRGPAVTTTVISDGAWSELRRVAAAGITVVAACDATVAAEANAHRVVLLPDPDGVA